MIKICTPNDLEQLTELSFSQNSIPERNSAFCCIARDSIKNDLLYSINDENSFVLGDFEDNTLIGLASFFVDEKRNMADCCGPFVITSRDFQSVAQSLINHACTILKEDAALNFFFDKRNVGLLNLLKQMNASDNGNEFILLLNRSDYKPCNCKYALVPLDKSHEKNFVELFDSIFPDMYICGDEVLNSDERSVFVYLENDKVKAFCVLLLRKEGDEAVSEILGVESSMRGKGIGRSMLNKLASQAFSHPQYNKISLVVDNINEVALNLYLSFGYKVKVENCSFRL